MKTEHTLHYRSAAEAQTAARILAQQSTMLRVNILPDGKSLQLSYDLPLLDLMLGLLSRVHGVADWRKNLKLRPRTAHA